MNSEPNHTNSMSLTVRQMVLHSLQIIFYGICNVMNWLLKPSALRLENDTLRAQIDTQKEELNVKINRNEELQKFNSDMDAKVMALRLEQGKMSDALEHLERRTTEGNEQIDGQIELIRRLEKRLQSTRQKNKELDAVLKKQKSLMENNVSEWKLKIDELSKGNRSLEASMRKHSGVIERQKRNIMSLEMGIGQLQAISTGLESEKEEMEKRCTRLEDENRKMADVISHGESRESN